MMGWPDFLQAQSEQPYFRDLQSQLQAARAQGQLVYPPEAMIFRAFDLTPFDAVRVVILGQDPYHGAGQAHGLAFSVPHGQAVPPSLKNIYKALQHDFADFQPPQHGCLEAWAQQGVLLLNTVLTVQAGQAHSHASWGWETLSDAAISALSAQRQGLVFMLWGAHAQKKAALIDPQRHLLLQAPHPSPLSAHRGFLQCGHFAQANAHLQRQGLPAIDWQI
jgi:uracil-DNA glycosylase